MSSVKYEELFSKDLGKSDFTYSPIIDSTAVYEASLWNPVLTSEGIWACKITITSNSKNNVTVMPGDNYIEAMLRAAKFLQERDSRLGINNLPEIIFPLEVDE